MFVLRNLKELPLAFWVIHLNYSFLADWASFHVKYICLLPALVAPCGLLFQNPLLCRCRCRCLRCSGRRKRWVEAEDFWLFAPLLGWASSPTPPGSRTLHVKQYSENKWRLWLWLHSFGKRFTHHSSVTTINLSVHELIQILGQVTLKCMRKQTEMYHHQKMQIFSQVYQGTAFHSRLWLLTQSPHLKHCTGPFISFFGLVTFQSYINIYKGVVKIIGATWMTISNIATTSHIQWKKI